MIELLATIAGFFTMSMQSLINVMGALTNLLPFVSDILVYMPASLAMATSTILAFSLVKFIISFF